MVWEYTDNSTGDTSSAKEEALRETAAKKGQVCVFLWSDGDVPFGRQLWVLCIGLSSCRSLPALLLHWSGFGERESLPSSVSQVDPGAYYVAHNGLELMVVVQPQSGILGL